MALRAVFTHDEKRYHVGLLKVREVEELEGVLACRYVDIQPLSRMTHKLALAAVFLRREHDEAATARILDELHLDAFDAMWAAEEDDLPKAWGEGLPLED